MVYEGGPSEGCDTCRARKVKCTLEKPRCERCQKAGFFCFGYARRPRSKLKLLGYRLDHVQDTTPDRDLIRLPKLNLDCRMGTASGWPVLSTSISFFLTQFVVIVSESGRRRGWLDFVPKLLTEEQESCPLQLAMQAISVLTFANRYQRPDLLQQALTLNGKALKAVNLAITLRTELGRDGLFVAILLLCFFGYINGDPCPQTKTHAVGMVQLLAMRDSMGVESKHTGSFIQHFLALLHLDDIDPYLFMQAFDRGALARPPFKLDNRDLFDRIGMLCPESAAVLNILHQAMILEQQGVDFHALREALQAVEDLEEVVAQAAQDLDPTWEFDTVYTKLPQNTSRDANTGRALIYRNGWVLGVWHTYRVTRISLNTALASAYDMLAADPQTDCARVRESMMSRRFHSLSVIDSMNEDICASIPWSLGQLDGGGEDHLPEASKASSSIAGLRAVISGTFTRQNHIVRAKAALHEIANRFGVRGAMKPL